MPTVKQLEPVYLIDASIYIFRAWYSMPDSWYAANGYSTNAVYGFAMFLLQFIEKVQPKYVALAFDESLGSCFRNKIYPDYKVSRSLPDPELAFQLQACRELAKKMGFATFSSKKYEADDLIASLAKRLGSYRRPLTIVTRDKDLGQLLLREHDKLWDYADDRYYFIKDIEKKMGVKPNQIADYLALVGDSIDDIPGVPGIGAKTAVRLLNVYPSIEILLAKLNHLGASDMRGAGSLVEALATHQDQLRMAKALTVLFDKAPLLVVLKDLRYIFPTQGRLEKFIKKMGFGQRTLKRIRNVYGWK